MKKLMALALALLLALSMGSVALAQQPEYTPGDQFDIEGEIPGCGVADENGEYCELTREHLLPGEKYALFYTADPGKDLKVTAEWTKGGALVAGISYEKKSRMGDYGDALIGTPDAAPTTGSTVDAPDAAAYALRAVTGDGFAVEEGTTGLWVLTLKENYTISDLKDLKGTITITGKDSTGAKKTVEYDLNKLVANHKITVQGDEDLDSARELEAANNTLYVCEDEADGYVKFNLKALLGATLNMVGKEKAFMYTDESAIAVLTEQFPKADIECFQFGGTPTFKNAAKFTLQADYADQYFVYSYENGKLVPQDYSWNSVEGVYEWETNTPATYVISDVELVAAAETTKNPDTGANDVVGVAAALAVVSLLSVAAISRKK